MAENEDKVIDWLDKQRTGGGREIHFETVDPSRWARTDPPHRQWLVRGLIPKGYVTMINGDGGIGKSLLALQLLYACATGNTWMGRETMACKGLGVFCEDDADELHRRTYDIARAMQFDADALSENVRISSRVGMINALMEFDSPWEVPGRETALYSRIALETERFGARLLVLDGLHDVYAGNENSRPQARAFIQALGQIAQDIDGAVVLLAHPSLSGMASGTGTSGSTAWNNAVRSRLYLTRPKGEEAEADEDVRELSSMKANYTRRGDRIRLRWVDGAFVCDEPAGGELTGQVAAIAMEQNVLQAARYLVSRGEKMAAAPFAKSGLAAKALRVAGCRSYTHAQIVAAQEKLLQSGKLVTVELGPPSKRVLYIRPVEQRLPGEAKEASS